MNKVTESSFHRIYFVFGGLFLLVTIWFAASLLLNGSGSSVSITIVIYGTIILMLSVLFIVLLKKRVSLVIRALDKIIDNAINGKENILIDYDETSISGLENKMYRFVKMSKSNSSAINEERNKIKSLISDISHQTKTPISNILLYSELLLDSPVIKEEEKQLAEGIRVQSEKLKWLIQSLVKMSRLETGIISANRACEPVFHAISDSIGAVFSDAEKKNIEIQVCCSESMEAFHDRKWTSEAVINILENAVKYTPLGGKITITVKQYEMFTEIAVSDTGIGINENEINSIFKRFYRSKDVSKYEGVGIGLYLAREIISSQGGYIKVKSELNKGSVFSIFLPNTK